MDMIRKRNEDDGREEGLWASIVTEARKSEQNMQGKDERNQQLIFFPSLTLLIAIITVIVPPEFSHAQDNWALNGEPWSRYEQGEGIGFLDLIFGFIFFAALAYAYDKWKFAGLAVFFVGIFSIAALAGVAYRALF
ncbi:hypothetical protein [Pseudodonghicola flavimaris]|uniref:Uncharacterized protein n=1 Tax=Pseudodonghicola flavimaris TaxID=3050036 RepID=A0ABT7EZZ4_9RHOB|nr:hypothetical protein [Pseudodonghicola flavimaris]MDK3017921.1 hypothetical protein [Pseudodonghicola flavimaris]